MKVIHPKLVEVIQKWHNETGRKISYKELKEQVKDLEFYKDVYNLEPCLLSMYLSGQLAIYIGTQDKILGTKEFKDSWKFSIVEIDKPCVDEIKGKKVKQIYKALKRAKEKMLDMEDVKVYSNIDCTEELILVNNAIKSIERKENVTNNRSK